MMKKPITLPLNPEINRCNAHGSRPHEWCDRRHNCAAHQTIIHDLPLWQAGHTLPVANRKCWTEHWVGYLPLEGFEVEDVETEGGAV